MIKENKLKIIFRTILCFIEIMLLLKVIFSFVHPRNAYSFFSEDMYSNGAIEVNMPENGWYIDNSIDLVNSIFLQTAPIDLSKGSYKIIIHYQSDGNGTSISLNAENPTYKLIAGRQNMLLDSSTSNQEFEFYLSEYEKNFYLTFQYDGNGYAWISEVDLMQTWAWERLHAFYALLIIILLEAFWFGVQRKIGQNLLKNDEFCKSLLTALIIGIPVILSSLPCFSYYIINGFDLNFHMLRIEGIAQGIKNGNFPVRIQTNWLKGYGYPVSIFYGDFLLYLPAVLRAIGMPLQNAYKIFLIFINILTGIIMYFSSKGISKSRAMAIFASYLYLLLPYRLSCIYIRAGVGEYCAMAFFPLIIWGLYRIYTIDSAAKEWKYIWILPAIGFSGVIQSHLLSTVFVGLFTVIFCLILFKKTFERKRFFALAKVVLATITLNATYLVPLLDYMQKEYKVSAIAKQARIQTQGAHISQIFSLFPSGDNFSVSISDDLGYANEMVFSLGIVAWIGIIIFLIYLFISIRNKALNKIRIEQHLEINSVYLFLGAGIITMILASTTFPWDFIISKIGFLKFIFTSIEFPWRYLSLSSAFFILGSSLALNSDMIKKDALQIVCLDYPFSKLIYIFIIGFSIASAGYFTSKVIADNNSLYIVANCDLDDSKLLGSEYIPVGVNEYSLLSLSEPEATNITLTEKHSTGRGYLVSVTDVQENGRISVPRIYYDGYSAKFESSPKWSKCYADELGRVCLDIPEGYNGNILIAFREPWYWRMAEFISLATMLGIIILRIYKHK